MPQSIYSNYRIDFSLKNLRCAQGGYTMLEMVVYVSVLAVLLSAAITGMVALTRSYAQLEVINRVNAAGAAVMERASREIRSAYAIDTSTSTLGIHPGKIALRSRDAVGTEHLTVLYAENGSVKVSVDGVLQGLLTRPDVTVDQFVVRATSTAASTLVRVELTVRSARGIASSTEHFFMSATTRGGY